MEKIGIVAVDYNNHKDTLELLKSSGQLNTTGFEVRWFLVDNGSDTYLGDSIDENFDGCDYEILQTGENKGFAGGYNMGISYALGWGASFILAINNDTLMGDPEILQKLVKTLKNEPRNAIVSPKILFAKGYEYQKGRYSSKEVGHVVWYGGGYIDWNNVFGKNRGIDEVDHGQYDRSEETDFISGCCFMVRAEVLEASGLFEEKLFAYFEDVDLMVRLKRKRYKLLYNGKTHIYHKVSRTAGIASKLTDYLITRNRLYVGFKYAPIKIRFSLWKESLRFFIGGREAQKQGVLDFFLARYREPSELDFLKDANSANTVSGSEMEKDYKFPLELSVITVNYKTKELTLELLESLFSRNSGLNSINAEVVVLDNGSEDQIEADIRRKFPQVKYIGLDHNTGFAKGYNRAIQYSKGKFILLLNSDIKAKAKSIEKILTFAKKKKGEAVVGGRLYLPDGSIQKSCYKLPDLAGAVKEYFFGRKGEYDLYAPIAEKPMTVEGMVMACFLIPARVFNKVGYLSEKSFLYFEDIEYCRRLKAAGVSLYYYPGAEFVHHHGASSEKIGKEIALGYLKKGAVSYHGHLKYFLLSSVLWLGQKKRLLF